MVVKMTNSSAVIRLAEWVARHPDRPPNGRELVTDPETGWTYDGDALRKATAWAAARGREVSEVSLARCRVVSAAELRRVSATAAW